MLVKSLDELDRLASDYSSFEMFGPGASNPYLIVDLRPEIDLSASFPGIMCDFLAKLPCPVIATTDTIPAYACDVYVLEEAKLSTLCKNIAAAPFAAMILVQHLRASENQDIHSALVNESLAYGVAQAGPEFKKWLIQNPQARSSPESSSPVEIDSSSEQLRITLTQPENRNAMTLTMRDALCEALNIGLIDEDIQKIVLTGSGPVFSSGGEVSEFGTVSDPATAHWIRTLRLPAYRLAKLGDKLEIHVNGAAIGAGVEMAAFGHRVAASPKAWFQLPELKYGLIPGAGGTVSLPRRIGRHKTVYMALTMERIRAPLALKWGLIDAITDPRDDI